MIAALIGDVHANLPALDAVLNHAHLNGAEAIWNIGDFVGYGAFPEEVVQRLRLAGAVSIQGNYDRKVLKVKQKKDKWEKTKVPEKWLAFQWAYRNLSKESRKYLRRLPKEMRLEVEGRKILLVHGSPASQNEPLDPDTPEERFRELAVLAQADLVVCGHSHRAFIRQVGSTWFVNTGSVGRPDDGDPRACYALLHLEPGEQEIRHYRIEYDVEKAAAAIFANHLPEDFAAMIRRGVNLDTIRSKT
ncbi:MAG: metallophosphatase family protein [Chloroflexi bacterium]|nr:metallophosphatase family protein [Chloroflexota bacterium]